MAIGPPPPDFFFDGSTALGLSGSGSTPLIAACEAFGAAISP